MQLLKEDDRLLRRKSKRVASVDDTIRNLAASLIVTMLENQGVGLAAPQVGILKQIIVVLINETPVIMINPEILETSAETCVMKEGCLSFPEQFLEIERPETVKVKYRCTKGRPVVKSYQGLNARIILHEIDHLNGVVFTERL